MNESDLNFQIQQKLADFDNIGSIQPTEAWRTSLYSRLAKEKKPHGYSGASGILIALIFLFLINLGFILNSVLRDSDSSGYQASDLQVLSGQLLINPTSLK